MSPRPFVAVVLISALVLCPVPLSRAEKRPREKRSLEQLIADLKNPKYGTRYGAAFELAALGRRAEPAIGALIDALGDDGAFNGSNRDFVWAMAHRTLLAIGRPALPALTAAAKGHADRRVRREALDVLGDMGREAQATIPVLQALLRDKDVQVTAARVLWRLDPEGQLTLRTLVPKAEPPVLVLAAGLRHEDPEQRREAARILGSIGPPASAAREALVGALRDHGDSLRALAAEALGALGPEGRPAAPSLRRALRDNSPLVRVHAAIALRKIGCADAETVRTLAALLEVAFPFERWRVIDELGALGPLAGPAVPALIPFLKDKQNDLSAAKALGRIGPAARSALPALLRAMKDPDTQVRSNLRCSATEAVGGLGPAAREAIPALLTALRDDWDEVRRAAERGLARLGPVAVPALVRALRDENADIRAGAARALGLTKAGGKDALPALRSALKDDRVPVRIEAAIALWEIAHEAAVGVLLDGLRSAEEPAWRRGPDTLRRMGPAAREAVPGLIALVRQKKYPGLAWAAVDVLRAVGPAAKDAVPALAEVLQPDRRSLQFQAAWTLGELGPLARGAVPALASALRNPEAHDRSAAAGALGRIGPDARQAVPDLTRALGDADPGVRAEAAYALGRIGRDARSAVPALARLLDDPQPIVRWAALAALQSLGLEARGAVPALGKLVQDQRNSLQQAPSRGEMMQRLEDELFNQVTGESRESEVNATPAQAAFRRERPTSVPELAIRVLLAMGPAAKEALPALFAACKDDRVTVRRAAVAAVRKIAPEAAETAVLTPAERESVWADLGSEPVEKAYHAAWTFVLAPDQAVPWLRDHVQPVPAPDAAGVARRMRELDDADFAVRERATRELLGLGELAVPALKKTQGSRPPLEVRRRIEMLLEQIDQGALPATHLRALRSVSVLERINTPEARKVLTALAGGTPDAILTREARAALARLCHAR